MTDADTTHGPARIALITGGNRGLGRSAALALAERGTDVILTYRSNEDEAHAVVADLEALGRRAVALRLDATEVETFPAFVDSVRAALRETWGRDTLDHLVNNAGLTAEGSITDATVADAQLLFDVHFKGVFFLTQALLPVLADGGSIVNLSTGLARFVGAPSYAIYASMKGAVEVLTRYLAKELGARGIRVNVVAPGPIATDFAGGYIRSNPEVAQAMGRNAALGRVGDPEDIGPVIAAVLSDAMGWVTAQRIEASGGTLL